MNAQATVQNYLDVTDALVRLYLFLAQAIDGCLNEAARIDYPEAELQSQLAATKATVLDMLSVNHVVKAKIEQECDCVHSLNMTCRGDGAEKVFALNELRAERAQLTHKIMALSDLLAVFRST